MSRTSIVALLALISTNLPSLASEGAYFLTIPSTGASASTGVSDDGRVVAGADFNGIQESFRWTSMDGVLSLGHLPGRDFGAAEGISGDGSVVVGWDSLTAGGGYLANAEAYRWTAKSGMVGLGSLHPSSQFKSLAGAVSADGSVVAGQTASLIGSQAFRWTVDSGMQGLGFIPGSPPTGASSAARGVSGDGQTIVGGSSSAAGYEAFRWNALSGMTGIGDLPGGDYNSAAFKVALDGNTIVGQGTSAFGREAFRWTAAGGMVGLGDLPGGDFWSESTAVSGDGSIVVGVGTGPNGYDSFIWNEEHGMTRLAEYLWSKFGLDVGEWDEFNVWGMTPDASTFVGGGSAAGIGGAWIAHVPEPSSLALMLVGAAAFFRGQCRWLLNCELKRHTSGS